MRIGKVDLVAGMQERGYNGANPTWLGFAYGSWIPQFRLRRNALYREFNWYWLCFHGFVTVWGK